MADNLALLYFCLWVLMKKAVIFLRSLFVPRVTDLNQLRKYYRQTHKMSRHTFNVNLPMPTYA